MRILLLHPAATELLFSIGASGNLVGRTDECDYPEAALKVPSLGPLSGLSAEMVDVFEPDLIITGRGQDELTEKLRKQYDVFNFSPKSLSELFTDMVKLAEHTGTQIEAEVVTHDLMNTLEKLKAKAQKFKKVRVYFEIEHSPPEASACYLSDIVTLAGGLPFYGPVTPERLQEFDPQIIIVSKEGEGEEYSEELLLARDGWSDLSAVKYERIFILDDDLFYRPGPRLINGIRRLAMILHGIDVSTKND